MELAFFFVINNSLHLVVLNERYFCSMYEEIELMSSCKSEWSNLDLIIRYNAISSVSMFISLLGGDA